MRDARSTPANQHVAHVSLLGQVNAKTFTEGVWMEVIQPIVALTRTQNGRRERELLLGTRFLVLEDRAGVSFGYCQYDNYVGYVESTALDIPVKTPSHQVSAIRTYAKDIADLKDTGPTVSLAFSSIVNVTGSKGAWSQITVNNRRMFVPSMHLSPIDNTFTDPVAVAELFVGTPYLWGGNSAFGIDCSGLVQAALKACALECPGDADQQLARVGFEIPKDAKPQRGDLLFWKGHVALCLNGDQMIHANATHMSVTCENIVQAESRIIAAGDGPIIARKRIHIDPKTQD